MTKDEQDYMKMQQQLLQLQEKMKQKKEILDKERDDEIIKAIREIDLPREDGFKLARLIEDRKSLEAIMKMEPQAATVKRKIKLNKESEEKKDEE